MNSAGRWCKPSLAGAILLLLILAPVSNAQAQSGSWFGTGSMSVARYSHTATPLKDGRVLVEGGSSLLGFTSTATAEIYNPATGTWTPTGSMHFGRTAHTATLLNDGRVLVAGGCMSDCSLFTATATAEIYNPATGTWTATDSMNFPRTAHTATVLNDGRVLVAGGWGCIGLSCFIGTKNAELYDPATGTWTNTGNMNFLRVAHTATLLNDGRVLVVGAGDCCFFTATAELYDPASGTWTNTGSMGMARAGHTATLLSDGRVLVAGGCGGHCFLEAATVTAELFNPATGTWSSTGNMSDAREFHAATLLGNGKVLVIGGLLAELGVYDKPQLNTAEEYDPVTGTWGSRTFMSTGRSLHTATPLNDGRVLVAAGVVGFYIDQDCFAFCNYFWYPSSVTSAAEIYIPAP